MLTIIVVALSTYVVYSVGLGLYRLFFHPLAKFPGPKYAVLSRWHERYYDVYLGGKFIFWIEEQHKKYGPVVRIAPDELHLLDADLWETVFTKAGRVDKYDWLSGRFGNETSVLTTAADSLHRVRRGALNPLFSRQRILGLQDVVREKVGILINRLENAKAVQAPVPLDRGFGAFSEDIIMRYCFGQDYDSLNQQGWSPILHDSFVGVTQFSNTALHFPLLLKVMNALPELLVEKLNPLCGLIFRLQKVGSVCPTVGSAMWPRLIPRYEQDLGEQIRATKASIASRDETTKDKKPTVFSELIEGDLPEAEKADRRLRDEAQTVIAAGLATSAWALSVGTFYLLSNPSVLARLRHELDDAIPSYDPANPTAVLEWTHLEKLPYLTAVIKEAIRLSYTTTSRNVRLLPKPIQCNEWTIPARTPVSMTIPFLNHDEKIFTNSKSFVPERWLDSPMADNGSPLERYFVGFGKGTRSCLGLNLAWCELYLVFAALFRFFDFELFETDITDIEFAHDFFIPFPKLDSKGVRVFVRSRE